MAFALMIGSLILLPKVASVIAMLVLIVVGIAEFRQGHIGRLGIFANSMLLWQIFYDSFQSLPPWFQWYLNIGTIIGVIALLSYLSYIVESPFMPHLPTEFDQGCFFLYGSISVAIIIGLFVFHIFQPAIAVNSTLVNQTV